MTEPHALSIIAAAEQMRTGRLSPVELVRSCLERIERLEPQLQAWVTLDAEAALAAAEACHTAIRQGHYRGPLHGIPIGLKDIFFTAGVKTTMGSPIYADFVPDYDATSVRRLKEAGAIMLGKAHTTEFAVLTPAPTRNPWNPEHTPGGSSSGSAAAVVAGMCPERSARRPMVRRSGRPPTVAVWVSNRAMAGSVPMGCIRSPGVWTRRDFQP